MMMAIIINDGQTQKNKTRFQYPKKNHCFLRNLFHFIFVRDQFTHQTTTTTTSTTNHFILSFFSKKMIRKISRNAQVSIKSLSYTSHWLITFDKDNFVFLQRIFFFYLFLSLRIGISIILEFSFSPYIISMATDFFYFD